MIRHVHFFGQKHHRLIDFLVTLVGSGVLFSSTTTFCSISKLCCDLIGRYVVLYILQKKTLVPTMNIEKQMFVGRQKDANVYLSMPTSRHYLATNLYTSVVDFIHFRRLVESLLDSLGRFM